VSGAVIHIEAPAPPPQPLSVELEPAALEAFESVPVRFGVVALGGLVAVYDPDDIYRNGIVEGAFYTVEYQRPWSGMNWETFRRLNCSRLHTEREVVKVRRWPRDPELWDMVHSGGQWHSGPICDINLGDMIVGRVVGIYLPTLAA